MLDAWGTKVPLTCVQVMDGELSSAAITLKMHQSFVQVRQYYEVVH